MLVTGDSHFPGIAATRPSFCPLPSIEQSLGKLLDPVSKVLNLFGTEKIDGSQQIPIDEPSSVFSDNRGQVVRDLLGSTTPLLDLIEFKFADVR